jgi:crossover junction endodeoxyribonuclease RusA
MPDFHLRLPLPYPPSINHYYRHVGNKVLISAEGREYRKRVNAYFLGQLADGELVDPMAGKLSVTLSVHCPDKRRRDLDNVQKPLLDALQHAGTYADDSQIDWLLTERCDVVPGGQVIVNISQCDWSEAVCPCCGRPR